MRAVRAILAARLERRAGLRLAVPCAELLFEAVGFGFGAVEEVVLGSAAADCAMAGNAIVSVTSAANARKADMGEEKPSILTLYADFDVDGLARESTAPPKRGAAVQLGTSLVPDW